MSTTHTTATIITIGDELLIGQTTDTNSGWIARQLNTIGIIVRRRIAIGDNREDMQSTLDEELSRTDLLIITGGLGPTKDDITKHFLNDYFHGKLVVDDRVLAHIRDIFTRRNRPLLATNLAQAEVPDVCTVLFNTLGTAPGMWFERGDKVVVSLPGVPYEMMSIFSDELMPALRQKFISGVIIHRNIVTAGEGESFIADRIAALEDALPPHIRLAYLPHPGGVRLRLTALGTDEASLIREVEARRAEIAQVLDSAVVSLEDLPLEQLLGQALTRRGQRIGLAESCTGGYIAHKITQVAGSAGYFPGSIVCYEQQVKEEIVGVDGGTIRARGIVSEAVALEMAQGARNVLHSDYGFGVTGLLSPGDDDTVPAGTVCMAITGDGRELVRTFHFRMDRLRNKDLAVEHALLMMLRFVNATA